MGRIGGFLSVLVVLSAVSGCVDDGASKEHAHDTHDHGQMMETANATKNATALIPKIVVVIDGNVTQPVNGSIPATVDANITFDGSNSTGDNLTFAWDFGDNETGTNAAEVHAYVAPGIFNVTLAITSGNQSANMSVLLNVTRATPVGGVVWMDAKSFTGTLPVGNPNAANFANTDHRDHVVTIVAADPNGTAVVAKRVRWTLDGSGTTAVDMTLYWRSGTTNLATGSTSNSVDEVLEYEGDMPAGDYVVRVRFNAGVNASYTVSGEIDYEAV